MKKIFYLLLTLPFFLTSCSNEDMAASEDTVQVSFCAEIPQPMATRASSTLSVDKVYCAVFEKGSEIKTLRQEVDVVDGQPIVFAPRLIKGRTYDIVFWASKEGAYDVNDMTAITRATAPESNFDAFTAHTEVFVSNSNQPTSIVLTRPLAQLNLGVTPEDWNGVASASTFNMIPTSITVSLTGKETFNALTGLATGDDKSISYNLSDLGSEFTVEEKTYKNIAMCYVLPDAQKENFDITFSVYDQDGDAIRSDVAINAVPLQANYKTNIVGGLLTGTVTFNISLQETFDNDNDNNKEIE